MSPEEKAEMEAAAKADAEASAEATEPSSKTSAAASAAAASAAADPLGQSVAGAANEAAQAEVGVSGENQALALHSSASGTSTPTAKADGEADAVGAAKKPESSKKGKPKLTPEQKAQLEALEKKQDEEKQKRIETLQDKLVQRIRPFVDAKNPGDINDAETKAFENRIRIEAEDLKLESFGVEVSHIIFFSACSTTDKISSDAPYHRSSLYYQSRQLFEEQKVLWWRFLRATKGEGRDDERGLELARFCVGCLCW